MKKLDKRGRSWRPFLFFFVLKTQIFAQNPCNAWANFPWHDWIGGVQIGAVAHPSGKSVYSNFTQKTPFLMKTGAQTPVLLTTGFSYEAFKESWAIWIDIDHDGIFHPTDELAFAAVQNAPADGTASFSTAGTIKLPSDALPGPTLLRVAMRRGNGGAGDPCDVLDYGEIEDFLVNVEIGAPPTNCQIKVDLVENWCIDTLKDSYRIGFQVLGSGSDWVTELNSEVFRGKVGDVFFPETNHEISGGEWLLTVRDSANLACKSSDKVVPPDPCFVDQNGQPAPDHCFAEASFPWHDWISAVKIGSFEMASGKSQYSDFSDNFSPGNAIEMTPGQSVPIILTTGFSYSTFQEFWKIWLDANQDGIFDDQTEAVFHGIASEPPVGTASKNLSGTLKVPADALAGFSRMRISMQRGAFASPCGGFHYGEVEDYLVNIEPNPNIISPGSGGFPTTVAQPRGLKTELWPNPASGLTSVFFEKKESGQIRLRLLDGTGRAVFSQKMTVESGPQSLEVPLENLPRGLYFWQLEKDGVAETGKLTVF